MTIGIEKLVCGNCNLSVDNRCLHGSETPNLKLSCFHIFKNFEDKRYALERLPEIKIDFERVNRVAKETLALFDRWEKK